LFRDGWAGASAGLTAVLTLAFALSAAFRPGATPWVALAALARAPGALWTARKGTRGTELRGAVAWGGLAALLGLASQWAALSEPIASGRPVAGHLSYLMTLAVLAALISVLNARTPGGGAWAILMALLVVVFLIPWLEAGVPRGGGGALALGRLRLENPWTLFFGLLVLAGVTNFLPTRFGPASVWLAAGFGVAYLGLTGWPEAKEARGVVWSAVPWLFSEAACAAARTERRGVNGPGRGRLENLWFWFRDHWGVVWGLRVMERFNRTAEAQGWTLRLTWQGLARGEGDDGAVDEPALTLLKGLVRRFARPDRLEEAAATGR